MTKKVGYHQIGFTRTTGRPLLVLADITIRDARARERFLNEQPQSTFKLDHVWHDVGSGNLTPESCGRESCTVCGGGNG